LRVLKECGRRKATQSKGPVTIGRGNARGKVCISPSPQKLRRQSLPSLVPHQTPSLGLNTS